MKSALKEIKMIKREVKRIRDGAMGHETTHITYVSCISILDKLNKIEKRVIHASESQQKLE